MFFKKHEKKTCPACLIIGIGALTFIGAMTVKCKGKALVDRVSAKWKSLCGKGTHGTVTPQCECGG